MRSVLTALLCGALLGCGGGSSGSGSGSLGSGWFTGAGRAAPETAEPVIVDPSVAITRISTAVLEPGLRGAILRVEGRAPQLGYHSARLQLVGPSPEGVVEAQLRAIAPSTPVEGRRAGQTLRAGTFIPNDLLARITRIQLTSDGQAITLRP